MKTTQIALIAALVALMSGCASTMTARNGEFAVSGYADPVTATAVAGNVTTNQYRAETDRIVAEKMLDKGMYPGYGAYGTGAYGGQGAGDYWYHYRSRGIVPYVQQPAVPQTSVTVVPRTATNPGGYATQQDLQRVEEKADDSLCMHYKAKLKAEGRPITPCPPIKK